jgi:hypothetical protein
LHVFQWNEAENNENKTENNFIQFHWFPTLKAFNINYKSACVLKADSNLSETVTKRKSTCKIIVVSRTRNKNTGKCITKFQYEFN